MKPKLRFKEFTDDWEEKKLGKVTSNIKSYSISRDKESESDLYYIHYGDIHKNIGYKNIITKGSLLPTIQLDNDKSYEYLKNGDIVVADASEDYKGIANALILQDIDNKNIVAGLHTIAYRPKINSLFLYYQLGTSHFKKYAYKVGTGMKVFGITKTNMQDYNFYLPSLLEQKKIGEFFSLLDQRIEKQERKVALLEEEKKGYMQQIFNQELRFKDEEGNNYPDWEEKKLGDIAKRITRKNKDTLNDNVLTISAKYGLINQLEFFDKKIASKDLSNYYLLYKNEFAYNKSYSNGYPFGAIKLLKKYDMGVVSSLYICFKIEEKVNIEFINELFESQNWNKYISSVAQEGARNHGLLNISVSDFFDMPIQLPSLSEQEKIANFLSLLDQRIEKEQEKLHLLKEEKKGLLQQMFV